MLNSDQPPPRVLIVCQHYWPESFRVNDISDFLIEKGCEVDVLCGIPNYPTGSFFEGYSYFKNRKQFHNGVNIRRVFEIPRGNNSNFRIFLNYISFPLASLFHIPRLLTKRYDKIFVFTYSPILMAISGIIVGKLTRTETVLYVLDLWPENLFSVLKLKNKFLRHIATVVSHWHYKNADKLLVMTDAMRMRIVEITKIADEKITTLPQACEKVYEINVHDEQLHSRFENGFNVVFAGNISPAQSFETIINAAKIILSQGINDINWIVVGDGMSRKWLENEVKKNKLSDCFYFEGHKPVEDIPKYTEIADILIGCLVKSELLEATVPAKVTSYIAAGKPIVMAIDGEARALINDVIKCGFAGPTEDADTLALNILKVYSMPQSQRDLMGLRSKKYHFENLERNIVLTKMYKFIFG
jgi:colanic acid biosynthesis glycosyl transferase WcaI